MSNLSDKDIYVNIIVHNGKNNSTSNMDYVEERDQPLLMNPEEWKMSVIRMDFPSYGLPKRKYAKPPVSPVVASAPDPQDPDNTRWSITLSYANNGGTALISRQFIAPLANNVDPTPVWTQTSQPVITSFQYMLASIDSAFKDAYDDIEAQYNVLDPLGFGAGAWAGDADASKRAQNPPFMVYNNNTGYFSIYNPFENRDNLPITLLTGSALPTSPAVANTYRTEIWFNFSLIKLFSSFDVTYASTYSNPTGQVARIHSFQLPIYSSANFGTAYLAGYDLLRQEFQTLNLWYDIYKILLLSKTMINRKEYIASENITDVGSLGVGNSKQLNILTDFDYEFETANATRIRYSPTSEFRWIDLMSNTPMKKIDVQVAILNKEDPANPIPLTLNPGDNFNVKLLFRKKRPLIIDDKKVYN